MRQPVRLRRWRRQGGALRRPAAKPGTADGEQPEMADPRFFDNRGPFRLDELQKVSGFELAAGADPTARVFDVAGLSQAGPQHLSFYENVRARKEFLATKAGCTPPEATGNVGLRS